jgi:hypothetical protein
MISEIVAIDANNFCQLQPKATAEKVLVDTASMHIRLGLEEKKINKIFCFSLNLQLFVC